MKILFSLLFALFLIGCKTSSKIDEAIEGKWSIVEFKRKNDSLNICMIVNIISFKEEGSMLPKLRRECFPGSKNLTQSFNYKILNDNENYFVEILSENEILSGTYQITFIRDETNSLLTMELSSETVFLKAAKFFFDYDSNLKLIEDLEEMTKKH